ncbi:MAG: histidinol dehydrogenase, partial [Eubacterium sp.]|nr:histidinol dehydrogenase [Eubacterium sp.]
MKITKANGKIEYQLIETLKKRNQETDNKIVKRVSSIIKGVKEGGDEAVREYTVRFDGSAPKKSVVEREELFEYLANADSEFRTALENAQKNIYEFHKRQIQQSWMTTQESGVIMGQRIRGLERVGIYVPGGTAAYPSSVLMNAIPAKIAGVKEIVMVTPPGKDGNPNPSIMAAAAIAGVDKVFLVGGAQAVAALAYGTEKIPKVDKIVGPGNIFVATAKRLLYGIVDIDMVAGPSEILIVADKTADPAFLAADLMSQAEHDKLASAILLSTSSDLAKQTLHEIEKQIRNLERKDIIKESLDNFGEII